MHKVKYLNIMVFSTLWLLTGNCLAQNPSMKAMESPVRTSLKSDTKTIVPNKPLKLFVDFDMEPGWHIYYKDPGQSGMPTRVDLTLPPGFTAQVLNWPPAETFKEAGIITYGYSKKVRLSTVITPSKTLKSGQSVKFQASASWLACKHSCVPGNSSVSLELKVQAK